MPRSGLRCLIFDDSFEHEVRPLALAAGLFVLRLPMDEAGGLDDARARGPIDAWRGVGPCRGWPGALGRAATRSLASRRRPAVSFRSLAHSLQRVSRPGYLRAEEKLAAECLCLPSHRGPPSLRAAWPLTSAHVVQAPAAKRVRKGRRENR